MSEMDFDPVSFRKHLPAARRELMRSILEQGESLETFFSAEDIDAYHSNPYDCGGPQLKFFETDDSDTEARARRDEVESALGEHAVAQEALMVQRIHSRLGEAGDAA